MEDCSSQLSVPASHLAGARKLQWTSNTWFYLEKMPTKDMNLVNHIVFLDHILFIGVLEAKGLTYQNHVSCVFCIPALSSVPTSIWHEVCRTWGSWMFLFIRAAWKLRTR